RLRGPRGIRRADAGHRPRGRRCDPGDGHAERWRPRLPRRRRVAHGDAADHPRARPARRTGRTRICPPDRRMVGRTAHGALSGPGRPGPLRAAGLFGLSARPGPHGPAGASDSRSRLRGWIDLTAMKEPSIVPPGCFRFAGLLLPAITLLALAT